MIKIESKRVGTLEVKEDRVIHFPEGLVGFTDLKHFVLADDADPGLAPFKWLIAVENPDVVFMVTDPGMFFGDYVFDVTAEDREFLGANTPEDVEVMTMLTVPDEATKITANLRAPLVVNWKTMVGRQLILSNPSYLTKHFIFVQTKNEETGTETFVTAIAAGREIAATANTTSR